MRRWLIPTLLLLLGAGVVSWFALDRGDPAPAAGDAGSGPSAGRAPDEPASSAQGPTLKAADSPLGGDAVGRGVGSTLRGQVLDAATDAPVSGARLIAFRAGREEGLRLAQTDAAGRFTVNGLDPGAWWLVAWHALYVPAGLDELLSAPKRTPPPDVLVIDVPEDGGALPVRVLRLHPGRRIQGRVIDAAGVPMARVQLRLGRGKWLRTFESRLGMRLQGWADYLPLWTDAAGRFSLACFPPSFGEIRLAARRQGMACRWSDPIATDPAELASDIVLTLLRTSTVRGHVRLTNGEPATGVRVDLDGAWALRRTWLFEPPDDVEVGPDGTYELARLPPDSIALSAGWRSPYLGGPSSTVEDLEPGDVRSGVDLTVPRRYVLRVRLRNPEGEPLVGETLLFPYAADRSADAEDEPVVSDSTNDEGRIVLGFAFPGPFAILRSQPGESEVLHRSLTLPAEEVELVSEGSKWSRIELRVTGPDGALIPRFRSAISVARDGRFGSDVDGRAGRAVHRMQGDPPFRVLVGQASDADGQDLGLTWGRTRIETVPADGIVPIRLRRAGLLHGGFVDADGQPVTGARLTLVRGFGDDAERTPIPVSTDGTFEFLVPEGEVDPRVKIEVPAGFVRLRSLLVDRDDGAARKFRLVPGGSVAGRVVAEEAFDFGDQPVVQVQWERHDSDPPSLVEWAFAPLRDDGRFEVTGVPLDREVEVGLNVWLVGERGFLPPDPLPGVRAGASELEFRLAQGLSIMGRVEGPGAKAFGEGMVLAIPPHHEDPPRMAQVGEKGTFVLAGLGRGRYRLQLIGGGVVLAIHDTTAGDRDVTFRLAALGEIPVQVETVGGFTLEMFTAGTVVRRVAVYPDEPHTVLQGLPSDEFYDLVVTADQDGRVGCHARARPGKSVTIQLVEAVAFAGQLESAISLEHSQVFARGNGCCFWLMVEDDGAFAADVMPGRYDVILVERNGTEHVVARNVEAGREDLELTLR